MRCCGEVGAEVTGVSVEYWETNERTLSEQRRRCRCVSHILHDVLTVLPVRICAGSRQTFDEAYEQVNGVLR